MNNPRLGTSVRDHLVQELKDTDFAHAFLDARGEYDLRVAQAIVSLEYFEIEVPLKLRPKLREIIAKLKE